MKRRTSGPALLAVFVAVAATAQPVPERVSFTGNLASEGAPASGPHDFVFTLYDAPTGGNVAWTEAQSQLTVTNGRVHAMLGSVVALGAGVLNGAPLFLEVSVDGSTLSPRLALLSVPYAVRAGTASSASALGVLLPGDVQRRVTGACSGANAIQSVDADGGVTCVSVVASSGDITAVSTASGSGLTGGAASGDVTLSLAPCASGESLKSNGSTWACQPNPAISGAAPVSVSAGGTVSLATCGANQVHKMNSGGTAWTCAADLDTAYVGTAPISISGTGVSLTTCGANQVHKMNSGGTAWTCAADLDTAYVGTAPISVSGTGVSLTTCGANQVHKMNSGGTAWTCAADSDTTYAAGGGLLLSSNTFSTDNAVVARKDSAAGSQAFDTSTLFLDYTNNRVGVGSTTPGYALDVSGTANMTTARAGSFTYSAAKTGVYYVPAPAFVPLMNGSDEVLNIFSGSSFFVSSGSPPFSLTAASALNLPNGVTMTSLTCYVYDNSSTQNIGGSALLAVNSPGATELSAYAAYYINDLSTTGASATKQARSSTGATTFDTANHYTLYFTYTITGLDSYNLRFYGCEVAYSYSVLNH